MNDLLTAISNHRLDALFLGTWFLCMWGLWCQRRYR